MIISRTPLRVSFVGGGTDLAGFYQQEYGQVLSTSIDKYLYVAVKRQLQIVEHRFRVSWSKIEFRDRVEDIEHPVVRETLKLLEIDFPIEITTFADIPANTGLGSSSTFAVGLLHALFALQGRVVTKATLAQLAAKIEIDILQRNIGAQDHYAAAYGNVNVLVFDRDGTVRVEPVFYKPAVKRAIEQNLMLFYTGLQRDASEVLAVQRSETAAKIDVLRAMRDLVPRLREVFSSEDPDVDDFGRILHEGWVLKRSLTSLVSNPEIDEWYARARNTGALGGKLLGAGGGGFLLLYAPESRQQAVKEALAPLHHQPFRFDDAGTRITYYDER